MTATTTRLPGPYEYAWDWQLEAACREADSQIFFHPSGERGARHHAREQAAKQVCARCPVLLTCRSYALDTQEPYGVWGGLSEEERQVQTARARRRGRTSERAAG